MTIADKLTLLASSKEALRVKLKLAKSVPFSKYPDYVNWNTAPSIPSKAFYADFTNDRYVKDGVPCGFKDLFTFTRAGKAWLVKDTGLQEYEADVPRLDNGLLIEQSATNVFISSINLSEVTYKSGAEFFDSAITGSKGALLREDITVRPRLYSITNLAASQQVTISALIDSSNNTATTNVVAVIQTTTSDIVLGSNNAIRFIKATVNAGSVKYFSGINITPVVTNTGKYVKVHALQIELGGLQSSHIVTTTAPVTRPADYLINKITGTTVTGDWDSTLNLSIVDGQLVHSGYGRIRSLEIN